MAREIYSRNWDRMSLEEQKEYRDRKLSYFVRTQLYPYSPFYRKLFDSSGVTPESIKKVEDLRRLPLTYKSDIAPTADEQMRFRDFVLQPDEETMTEHLPALKRGWVGMQRAFRGEENVRRDLMMKYNPVHIQFTTGTTGLPTPILYASQDIERMAEAGRRIMELAGLGTDIRLHEAMAVNVMPFAPHQGFWMAVTMLDRFGVLSLHTGGGRVLGTERIISSIENMRATVIVGMPGYVYHVLRTASESGRDLSSLRLVLIGGERVSSGMKERLAALLESMDAKDGRVVGALGFTEARKAYSECSKDPSSGYHLYPDMDYIELVDPESGEPVGEGEDGELVYTCLEGQGTCVLRFCTGDFVRGGIVTEPCPGCGRMVPRLSSDITRSGKVQGFSLTKIKGTLVDQGAFFSVLDGNPQVLDWQVEITKSGGDPYEVDELDILVAPAEGADTEALGAEIEAAVVAATEVTPNSVRFVTAAALDERLTAQDGLKELRVVDRRPVE